MDQDINNKKRKGEQAMVLLYEKNGKVEYQFESKRFVVNSQHLVNQLSALDVSSTTRIMVPVELTVLNNTDDPHRLGRVIGATEITVENPENANDGEEGNEDVIAEQIHWESQLNDLLFTLQSYHKDQFPFGFEAFGIADLRGPPGFTLFYSNRIGKFYIKTDNVRREEKDLDLFIKGVVNGPASVPMIQAIHQPSTAKSVKIIKMTEVVFKGILFIGWHKEKSSGEEKWIGWNDHIGMPKFTPNCSRNVLKKNSDWDFRLTFATFSAFFNPTSREWRITELSYSDLEIAKRENHIPCSLFVIDDLRFQGVKENEGVFVSRFQTRDNGAPLQVIVKDENCVFDPNNLDQDYAAIVCPIYSNGGLYVSFRALSLFTRQDWLDCPYKKDLVRQFYTWSAGRIKSEKIGQCDNPEIRI